MGYYKELLTARNDDSFDTYEVMINAAKVRIQRIEERISELLNGGDRHELLTEYSCTYFHERTDLETCLPEHLFTVEDCLRAINAGWDTIDVCRRKQEEDEADTDILPGQMDIREFIPYRKLYGCA